MLDDAALAELEAATAAHHEWLSSQGLDIPGPPGRMTALDVLLTIEEAKARDDLVKPELAVAVMSGLKRLCALRTRAVGLERFRSDLEQRWAERPRDPAQKAKRKRDTASAGAALDDKAVKLMERRVKELQKRGNSFTKGLRIYSDDLDKRQAKLAKAGHESSLIASARHRMGIGWMESQVAHLLSELAWFIADARGTAATDPIGHIGEADNKSWHRVRGECLAALQEHGAPNRLRKALYPSKDKDPEREKLRNQQRTRCAKKLAIVAT